MANIVHTVWFFICLNFLKLSSSYGEIGDPCIIENNGGSGVCRLLSNCTVAIQALQTQGIHPQSCGSFQRNIPIVCCTTMKATKRTKVRTIQKATIKPTNRSTSSTRSPVRPQPVGDISRTKCKEYNQYWEKYELLPILRPDANIVVKKDCPIVPIKLSETASNTRPKEFAHMALIGFDGENDETVWKCGGSLISELFVLTAVHCVLFPDFGEAKYVRLGELVLNIDSDDAMPQEFNIAEIIIHPDYAPPSRYNDIALVKLDQPADLNPYVRPACLDTTDTVNAPFGVESGWGSIGLTDSSPHMLKFSAEFFSHDDCYKTYEKNIGLLLSNGIMEKIQICAGSHDNVDPICQGNSGGPLQIINQVEECMYTIVGVANFLKGCGVGNFPFVYTRVSSYIEWIERTVW